MKCVADFATGQRMADSAAQNFSTNDPYSPQSDDVFKPSPGAEAAKAATDNYAKNEPYAGADPFVPPSGAPPTSSPPDDARNIPSPCQDMTGPGACPPGGRSPSGETEKSPGSQTNDQSASVPATQPTPPPKPPGAGTHPKTWTDLSSNLRGLWNGAKANCSSASALEKNTAAWFDMCGKPPGAKNNDATGESAGPAARQSQTAMTDGTSQFSPAAPKAQNDTDSSATDLCGALHKSAAICYERLVDTMSGHGENGLVSSSGQGESYLTCIKVYCSAMLKAKCSMLGTKKKSLSFCFTQATDDPDYVQLRNAACGPGKHLYIDPHSVEPICQDNVSGSGNPQVPSDSTITGVK